MAKTSDWKIVATEGATVDGRTITAAWIKDMAETYSHDSTTALIWPEHYKGDTPWGPYDGKNWGVVEELKAEKRSGKLRLFARLTPNHYLLSANKDGQKLFTSIEPDLDYCGTGRCYLRGLAVTDKPASTGTSRLQFSDSNGKDVVLEVSQLEELDFSECHPKSNPVSAFFSALANLAMHGELPNIVQPTLSVNEDEEPMNQEQFNTLMGKLDTIEEKTNELETKQNEFSAQLEQRDGGDGEETPPEANAKPDAGITAEQFSQLTEKLDGIATKQSELDTKFNQLAQEHPGQHLGLGGDESNDAMKVV